MLKTIIKIFIAPFAFITKYFKACIFFLILALIFANFNNEYTIDKNINLAKIYLNGPIVDSNSIYEQIKKIDTNPNIKGVLLLINSPGGAVGASVEISDLIKELNLKIPVVAYVQGVMASGSYYGGMHASKIFANRGALIGSIGVIFSSMNVENLMQKIGISTQGISAGEYKEIGTPMRKWTPQEKEFLNNLIQEEYHMFISDVAEARKLSISDYKKFAEGKIFSAKNAQKLGLIDEVGSMDDAINALKDLSQVQDPVWLEKNKFDDYLEKFLNSSTQLLLKNFTYQIY
ncbi:signal peptide peptidase SppA [Helicobacter anatolicus]|uniref:signal peptide peptidase SppA n=1 Tax=Helicobacter anatolicus TaxID=2905874 RepID=UPI003A1010DF